MKNLLAIFFLFFICCGQKRINPDSVESIALIQVTHPYIGQRVDSIKLDDKLILNFLKDFADRKEEITKFYSCYVINIHLKNGELISYRTNGHAFEKFMDANTDAALFRLNKDINLVTKYWGITADKFCQEKEVATNFSESSFDSLTEKYKTILSKDSMDWSATYQLGQLYHDASLHWLKLSQTDSIKSDSKSFTANNEKALYFMNVSKSLEKAESIASETGDADYPPAKQ